MERLSLGTDVRGGREGVWVEVDRKTMGPKSQTMRTYERCLDECGGSS